MYQYFIILFSLDGVLKLSVCDSMTKDAMPVSYGQNCLQLIFQPFLSSETYSRKYEKLPNVVTFTC